MWLSLLQSELQLSEHKLNNHHNHVQVCVSHTVLNGLISTSCMIRAQNRVPFSYLHSDSRTPRHDKKLILKSRLRFRTPLYDKKIALFMLHRPWLSSPRSMWLSLGSKISKLQGPHLCPPCPGMYACVYVYEFMYVCMHVWMYVCMCVALLATLCVRMYIAVCMYAYGVCVCVCVRTYAYVCMYVCVYTYINTLKYIHIYIHTYLDELCDFF